MSPAPSDSVLQDDLASDSHDASYRAMSFIAARGGPQIEGPAAERANLIAQRAGMLVWLELHQDPGELARAYTDYLEKWSPVFRD